MGGSVVSRCQVVSDMPGNSLQDLLSAVIRLSGDSSGEVISWSLEPDTWDWEIQRVGDQGILTLSVSGLESEEFRCSFSFLRDCVLKGLSDLVKEPIWECDKSELQNWSWPFPSAELASLKSLVQDA